MYFMNRVLHVLGARAQLVFADLNFGSSKNYLLQLQYQYALLCTSTRHNTDVTCLQSIRSVMDERETESLYTDTERDYTIQICHLPLSSRSQHKRGTSLCQMVST